MGAAGPQRREESNGRRSTPTPRRPARANGASPANGRPRAGHAGGAATAATAAVGRAPMKHSFTIPSDFTACNDIQLRIMEDVEQNGAPLIWRVDRASVHRCPQVREVLDGHGILVLHGPPRHPRYYGQLERMNRDHREWLEALGPLDPARLAEEVERMRATLNAVLPRRSLHWRTAAQVWGQRPALDVDRAGFRDEVRERAARLALSHAGLRAYDGLVDRLAIEAALTSRGLLKCDRGGWC